jgi:hypothetical protein
LNAEVVTSTEPRMISVFIVSQFVAAVSFDSKFRECDLSLEFRCLDWFRFDRLGEDKTAGQDCERENKYQFFHDGNYL